MYDPCVQVRYNPVSRNHSLKYSGGALHGPADLPLSFDHNFDRSASFISDNIYWAVLYYTSCWDCVGMKFETVGIDPNCRHPKPRPATPQDLFKTLLFLYQKENYRNT